MHEEVETEEILDLAIDEGGTEEPSAPTDAPPAEGQPAEVEADPTYTVGGQEYKASQLAEYVTDVTNVRAMRTSAQEKYDTASRMRDEAEALRNDPELNDLRYVMRAIQQDPQVAQEWAMLRQSVSQGVPNFNPAMTRMSYQNQVLQEQVDHSRQELVEAKALDGVQKFRGQHPEMDDNTFLAFYNECEAHMPNFKDLLASGQDPAGILNYHYHTKHGQAESEAKIAQARESARAEVVASVKQGREASLVTPTSHTEVPWEPDMDRPDFEDCVQAALNDPDLPWGS